MNKTDIYEKFKNVLSGCRNINDSLYFAKRILDKYPQYNKLLISMIYGKTYDNNIDIRTLRNILNLLNNCDSHTQIDEFINTNSPHLDINQINALLKLNKIKKEHKNDNNKNIIYKINNKFIF